MNTKQGGNLFSTSFLLTETAAVELAVLLLHPSEFISNTRRRMLYNDDAAARRSITNLSLVYVSKIINTTRCSRFSRSYVMHILLSFAPIFGHFLSADMNINDIN